ncbi:TetR/AcrR family transcriptional regulator [Sinomonas sp. R1AF57]|uniref:TetR/AcrR family transcriptional regulator n=1 Tax=Sinomonas sp. R1AF57 TaxID=2020377 RepID=UPI000B6112E4|nr:TetR/AcrR family transcriptional regulator [Sinomonas sp. R1AF57]ASN53354.1 TetR family transcriptional regulator [Sinomonas sp. R1AF57]
MAKRRSVHHTTPENEKAILDAVLGLAVEAGYEGTTMSEVARVSGLPIGSVYWHFENKEKLFVALLDYCFGLWRDSVGGRSQRELLGSSIAGAAAPRSNPANAKHAFWVIGLVFALEKRLEDNEARQKYLQIRADMFETALGQVGGQFPAEALGADPEFARKIVAFGRALTEGFYVSASAGDDVDFKELAELSTLAVDLLTEHYAKRGAEAKSKEGDS